MDAETRDALIDAYYDGLDAEDYGFVRTAFAEDVEYCYPGEGPIVGRDAVEEFFEERRRTTNTTHEVSRRIHDDEATACEGHVTGEISDKGALDAGFVGIFEFDERAECIRYAAVYTRD